MHNDVGIYVYLNDVELKMLYHCENSKGRGEGGDRDSLGML